MSSEQMDVAEVRERLARAIALQMGSLVSLPLLAGTVTGLSSAGLKSRLLDYAVAEVEDTVLLVEKLVALGGALSSFDAVPPPGSGFSAAAQDFLDREEQLMLALHAVIEPSGQKPASEALEHRIEHVLMRKQEQIDFLRLALRD